MVKSSPARGSEVRLALAVLASVALATTAFPADRDGIVPPGVQRPDLAWQHWVLNCQGCHRPDATGSVDTAPALAGVVGKYTGVPGGREYLGRVPGVATAPLSDADLAELLNWVLWRFDRADLDASFRPYTAEEVRVLRQRPLRTEASQVRARLVAKMRR
jgi:cytochrome c553